MHEDEVFPPPPLQVKSCNVNVTKQSNINQKLKIIKLILYGETT